MTTLTSLHGIKKRRRDDTAINENWNSLCIIFHGNIACCKIWIRRNRDERARFLYHQLFERSSCLLQSLKNNRNDDVLCNSCSPCHLGMCLFFCSWGKTFGFTWLHFIKKSLKCWAWPNNRRSNVCFPGFINLITSSLAYFMCFNHSNSLYVLIWLCFVSLIYINNLLKQTKGIDFNGCGIKATDRTQCGIKGNTLDKQECLARRCCYDQTDHGSDVAKCFYPKREKINIGIRDLNAHCYIDSQSYTFSQFSWSYLHIFHWLHVIFSYFIAILAYSIKLSMNFTLGHGLIYSYNFQVCYLKNVWWIMRTRTIVATTASLRQSA